MKDPQYPADDGLSPADLMRYSVQLYSEYDGSKMTVDNHSDEWLEQHKIFKEEDREFLHQVQFHEFLSNPNFTSSRKYTTLI